MKFSPLPHAVLCSSLLFVGGCCCCWSGGSWTPPTVTTDDSEMYDASGDDGSGNGGAALDPDASKEMQDAREYAQKALSAKGYGQVKTVNLQKDGTNWYVTGTAAGLDGGQVSYNVWFVVTTSQTENQVKHTWAVKTVTVDGEVVYP